MCAHVEHVGHACFVHVLNLVHFVVFGFRRKGNTFSLLLRLVLGKKNTKKNVHFHIITCVRHPLVVENGTKYHFLKLDTKGFVHKKTAHFYLIPERRYRPLKFSIIFSLFLSSLLGCVCVKHTILLCFSGAQSAAGSI